MKIEQLKAMQANGEPVLLVEYRSSSAEIIKWRDKVSHATLSAPVLRHTVEGGNRSFAVSERVDDKFDVTSYQPPFKKGDRVVLRFSAMTTEKGSSTFSGSLEPLTA